ncbi:uncharacterized protein PAC_04691 [Phialocephala subalpina]|uniref:Uncharacterized protein n=1 Tax=Phialocephala subalpina TaxID=576137 RepID=A0A1L7WPW3_9HELO|nr:uncharacterized protein PAC_04691 [Phialocephala subalpina]
MTTMAATKSKEELQAEIGAQEGQLLASVTELVKIDSAFAETKIIQRFDDSLSKHNDQVAEEKKQRDAKKVADLEIMGSDAESEDEYSMQKAAQLADIAWREKWALRREKKIAEAVKVALKEKRDKVKNVMAGASKLFAVLNSEIGGDESGEPKPDTSADSIEVVETSTKLSTAQQELTKAITETEKYKKECQKLKKDLTNHKTQVKAAFDGDGPAKVDDEKKAHPMTPADIIASKLKEAYFPEQLLSISQVFSVLQSLKPEDAALAFCLREIAKHQGRLVEVVYKDKTRKEQVKKLKEQNKGLKEEVKDLEEEVEELKEDTKEHANTKVSLDAAKKEAAKFELVAIGLKQELLNKDPLFKVGVTVRVGFMEAVKRTWVNGDLMIVRGDPDKDIIIAKNDAVHRANFLADKSLFTLGILKHQGEMDDFKYVYKVSNRDEASGRPLIIHNLWGSMVACYFKTAHTHDKVKDDNFEKLYNDCRGLFEKYRKEIPGAEATKKFASCSTVGGKIAVMEGILADTIKKEQKRLRGGQQY